MKSINRQHPQWSYAQHHEHDNNMVKESTLPSCYTDPESIDAWRHERMHRTILPLVRTFPDASWLTVGDGKYGSDAYFLKCNGAEVVASSLSEATLTEAKQQGYLENIMAQNAECMSAADGEYDFVLCKEAYHHFPRPPIAFYEMLRVCAQGAVLIEPVEGRNRLLDCLKILVKKLLRKNTSMLFEPSGNYIYKVNVNEIARMMTALNYELVSYKYLNDFYHAKLSGRKFRKYSMATLATLTGIGMQNILCAVGLMNYGLVTVVAFKEIPSNEVQDELKKEGFHHKHLPINPYREN